MRFVVVPQAVRRVVPPLLNDFIGLQKDTVLVSTIGVVEIFRESQILVAANFNFTPYVATALVFLVVTIPLARFTDWLIARAAAPGHGAGRQRPAERDLLRQPPVRRAERGTVTTPRPRRRVSCRPAARTPPCTSTGCGSRSAS